MIRPFKKSDVKTLLEAKNFGFIDGWNESMILSAINAGNFYGFIAEEGVVKGFITYSLSLDFAEINDVFVFPEYRRTGVGGELIVKLICAAVNAGKQKIFLEVRDNNLAAKALYCKYGFKKLYQRKKYYGDEDATVMVKELNS